MKVYRPFTADILLVLGVFLPRKPCATSAVPHWRPSVMWAMQHGVWLNRSQENRRCWSDMPRKEGWGRGWTRFGDSKNKHIGNNGSRERKNRSLVLKVFVFIKAVSSLGLRLGRCSRAKRGLRDRYMIMGKVKEGRQKRHREPTLPMLWPRKSFYYRAMNMVRMIREWYKLPTVCRNEKSTHFIECVKGF